MFCTKEVESFIVSKIACLLCDQGQDSILYIGEGYKCWTMTLDLLYEVDVGSHIELSSTRNQL